MRNKKNQTFTLFDMQSFYTSVKENLLEKAISFAQKYNYFTKRHGGNISLHNIIIIPQRRSID